MAPQSTQPSQLQRSCVPFDVLTIEILPRLPVKSLLRFKTVCKSFKTLISSSDFAYLHLRMCNASENHYIVVIKDDNNFHYFCLHSLSAPSATFRLQPTSHLYIYSSIYGSCNGLLLVKSSRTVKLLNPSTRTYIDVSLDGPHAAACNCDGHSTFGFGFDYRTNDYKIVKVCLKCSSKTTAPKRRITFVYSVNSKSWTFVDDKCPSDYSHGLLGGDGVLINNHLLHWMLYPRVGSPIGNNIRIACFDIYTEKWADDVLFPDCYYNRSPLGSVVRVMSFGVFEGGMYAMLENCKDSRYEMWVMKEYGVQESWVKLFKVPFNMAPCSRLVPIAYRGQHSNEVLLWQQRYNGSTMEWYNVRDNNVCNYVSEGYDSHFGNSQPYRCNGSLVTLPSAKPML